jgi:hypothetical protein
MLGEFAPQNVKIIQRQYIDMATLLLSCINSAILKYEKGAKLVINGAG